MNIVMFQLNTFTLIVDHYSGGFSKPLRESSFTANFLLIHTFNLIHFFFPHNPHIQPSPRRNRTRRSAIPRFPILAWKGVEHPHAISTFRWLGHSVFYLAHQLRLERSHGARDIAGKWAHEQDLATRVVVLHGFARCAAFGAGDSEA
jgi:hypothetical protein